MRERAVVVASSSSSSSSLVRQHCGLVQQRAGYASKNPLLGGSEDIFTNTFAELKQKQEEPRVTTVVTQSRNLPASLKRVDHLLRQIRRLNYREAVIQLRFSQKRIAHKLIEAIEKARYRAEVKYGLNPERLLLGTPLAYSSHNSRSWLCLYANCSGPW